MERYRNIDKIKPQGQRKYTETVTYPIIPRKIGDTYIIGQQGDRIDNLAWEYYKDPSLWWVIARANGIGLGNLVVPVGKQIRIPSDVQSIVDEYNRLNKVNL